MHPFGLYSSCTLCPRECHVNRSKGVLGVCHETAQCYIAFIGPHFGEEPSFTGTRGSGTIFFRGCSSHCFFCQNHQISLGHEGRVMTVEQLLEAMCALRDQGVHNFNFVTPDHFWPHVQEVSRRLREQGIVLPHILNSSGYQKREMIADYAEAMDIFLPDFKFFDPNLALFCMGDAEYPKVALKAIQTMVKAKGFLSPWDPTGENTAEKGVLVRHLVLPGKIESSLGVLRLLHQEFGKELPLSIMSQYQPMPECFEKKALDRLLTEEEYDRVIDRVMELGFENVYMQELKKETDFLPDFKKVEDPFSGNLKKNDQNDRGL